MSEIHMMAALLSRIDPELSATPAATATANAANGHAAKVVPITQSSKAKIDKSA